jgi:hypothetical protein
MLKNKKTMHWMKNAAALTIAALLVACGGGGGGAAGVAGKSITVVPALGGFSAGAVVEAFKPNGDLIKATTTTAAGEASIDMAGYDGPFILKVSGAAGVSYYDEKAGAAKDFSNATDYLLSVVPTTTITSGSAYGVTPLTNMVAALAGVDGLAPTVAGAATADVVANINQAVKFTQDILGVDSKTLDVLAAPTPVRADRLKVSSGSASGLYGLLLAEMANKSTSGSPLAQAKLIYSRAIKVKQSNFASGLTDLDAVLTPLTQAQAALATGASSFLTADAKLTFAYTAKTAATASSTVAKTEVAARTINVVPALGAFGEGAKVSVIDPTTGTELAFKNTNASGVAVVDIGNYSGPMVLRVTGATGVKFYDEGLLGDVDFGSTRAMLAIVPADSLTSGSSYGITPFTHLAAVFAGLTANTLKVSKPTGGTESDTMTNALARTRLLLGLRSDTSKLRNIHTLNLLTAPTVLSSTTASVGIDLSTPGGYMGYLLAEVARASRASTSTSAIDFAERLAAAGLKLKTAIDGGQASAITTAVEEFKSSTELANIKQATAQIGSGNNKFVKTCISVNASDAAYLKNLFTQAADAINLNPSAAQLAEMEINVQSAVLQQSMGNTYSLAKTSTCTP